MQVSKIPISQLNPAAYNPRKDLQPGDPDHVVSKQEIQEDKKEYEALMIPGTYSGKAERHRGAITQKHSSVFK